MNVTAAAARNRKPPSPCRIIAALSKSLAAAATPAPVFSSQRDVREQHQKKPMIGKPQVSHLRRFEAATTRNGSL